MECEHQAGKIERPLTVVTFSETEAAAALWDYANKRQGPMPSGTTFVSGIQPNCDLVLRIRRVEGQNVWPPAT